MSIKNSSSLFAWDIDIYWLWSKPIDFIDGIEAIEDIEAVYKWSEAFRYSFLQILYSSFMLLIMLVVVVLAGVADNDEDDDNDGNLIFISRHLQWL